jgi:hypothetical protein
MREISNFTELVRTIFYDVVGLLIPGLFFLTLLLLLVGYCSKAEAPFELIKAMPWQPKATLGAALVVAYVLGHLIESVWFMHSYLLLELGRRLLGRPEPEEWPEKWPSIFQRGNVATPLAREGFEKRLFYLHAREVIGRRAGFVKPDDLDFPDVGSLAHSFAGAQADLARQFRYRGDLCGAISTMALLAALGLGPLLVLRGRYPWYWCLVPALLALWVVVLALPTFPKLFSRDSQLPPQPNANKKTAPDVVARAGRGRRALVLARRVVLPLILMAVPVFLAWRTHGWLFVWALPSLLMVWLFMLWRAYFYLNLGGRVHFGIALAAITGQPAESSMAAISEGGTGVRQVGPATDRLKASNSTTAA